LALVDILFCDVSWPKKSTKVGAPQNIMITQ